MTKKICCLACWCSIVIGMESPICKRYFIDTSLSLDSMEIVSKLEQKILAEQDCTSVELKSADELNLLVQYNKEKAIEKLLAKNIIVPTIEHIQKAIAFGYTSLAILFIQHNPALMKTKTHMGNLLHIASLYNNTILAEKLLASGIDVNSVNEYHDTPLHLAAKKGLETMVAFLCEHGANPFITNVRKFNRNFNAMDVAYRNMFRFKDRRDVLLTAVHRREVYYKILKTMYRYVGKFGGSVNENYIVN